MINIEGIKVSKNDINNCKLIAKDLMHYGYNFNYFYENYTNKLYKNDSFKIWNDVKNEMCEL